MNAHPDCPCCEGGGVVPSASGWTDVPCLCATLDGNDRVILSGRADWVRWMRTQQPADLAWHEQQIAEQVERMRHLVMGCAGPCRGNSSSVPRCVA